MCFATLSNVKAKKGNLFDCALVITRPQYICYRQRHQQSGFITSQSTLFVTNLRHYTYNQNRYDIK